MTYTDDSISTTSEPFEDDVDDDSTLPSYNEITKPDSVGEEVWDMFEWIKKPCMIFTKTLFFKAYTPFFNSVSDTHFITPEKKNEVKKALLQPKQPKEPQLISKWNGQYSVGSNIDGLCLYRVGLMYATL
jgi:hypothetical protein